MQHARPRLNPGANKRTRKRQFLAQMDALVPWDALAALIGPHWPAGKTGRPPFAITTMLRIHFMQQWFTLSDPAMEDALYDIPMFRKFAKLNWQQRLPDESTILRFRHLLKRHALAPRIMERVNDLLYAKGLTLKAGSVVDATLISHQVWSRAPPRHALAGCIKPERTAHGALA